MNYAQLIYEILKIAINSKGINYAGNGDIESINDLDIKNYPVFWITSTQPVNEYENYINYSFTIYYVDRTKYEYDDKHDTNNPGIHSAGISILSNILKNIVEQLQPLNDVYPVGYNLWTNAEMLNDDCEGVYADIQLNFPKITNCPV